LQKVHLAAHDVPLPEFMSVPDLAAAKDAGLRFGYPYMLKNRKLAYDGKGTESELPVLRSRDFILSISLAFPRLPLPTHPT
jgi:phosphoribosylaminoimidazole carboxylase (NCAIR synthetase)